MHILKLRQTVGTYGVNLRRFPPLAGLGGPVQENIFLSLAGLGGPVQENIFPALAGLGGSVQENIFLSLADKDSGQSAKREYFSY